MGRRLSPQSGDVLRALVADPGQWRYGYELGQEVGLPAGSLYPILMRLSDRGLLEGSWESNPPSGRPPRHLYRLTAMGQLVAADLPAMPAAVEHVRAVGPRRRDPRGAW